MYRYSFIFLVFLNLITFSSINAQACSAAPSVVPWAPGYKIYNHFDKKKPFSEFDSISIVTPSFEEVKEKDFEEFRYTTEGREKYTHVKFNALKVLKGKKVTNFYLRGGGTGFETVRRSVKTEKSKKLKKSIIRDPRYLTNLSVKDKENYYWSVVYDEALSIAKFRATSGFHETSDFFDLFDLTIPRIGEPTTAVTCGNHIEYTVFPEMTYIAFRKGDRVVYLEPISDDDDPLIATISSLLRDELPKKLNTTLSKFLNSKRVVIFEILDCPTKDEYLDHIESKIPSILKTKKFKKVRSYSNKEYYTFPYSKFDILYDTETWRRSHHPTSFTLADLSNYFASSSNIDLKCNSGDLYMGVEQSSDYNRVYPAFRYQSRKYAWRFLRIQNQDVISSDLMTNISISGASQIPISEFIR